MPEPIRVLHFADVHIGMENYGKTDAESGLSSRVVDFLRRMDEMVEYARGHEVDLVIFAGDAFKTRTPNPTFQREFAWRIRDLAELAPVVMLVGNHDMPPSRIKASSIEIYDTLAVPNVIVAHDYDVKRLTTRRGDVVVGYAPYPIRSRLMELSEQATLSIREADHSLEESLTNLLVELAEKADQAAGADEIPRLLTGHFSVRGAVTGTERNVMLGRDVLISLHLLADTRWDYVALGHIHKHQNLTAGREGVPPVVYSGSLERIDFGEESDPKGFCWVELQRGAANWEFVRVNARPMVTLRIDCRKDTNPTRTVVTEIRRHHLQDAIVRIIVSLTAETNSNFNDTPVREAMKLAGVFHVAGITRDLERSNRARLGTNPEGLAPLELLEQYLINRDTKPDERAVLLEAAKDIINPQE